MATRKHIFIVRTPVIALPTVRLWDDTWTNHIIKHHTEMVGKGGLVRRTLQAPYLVCAGNGAGTFMFVNDSELDHLGKPLVVAVGTHDSSGYPAVASAYYGNKWYLDKAKVRLIWP